MTLNSQPFQDKRPTSSVGDRFIGAIVSLIVIIGGLILFGWLINIPGETLTNCKVTDTRVSTSNRSAPKSLIVESSCGRVVSKNIAHRTTIKVGETYTFEMKGWPTPEIKKVINENPQPAFPVPDIPEITVPDVPDI